MIAQDDIEVLDECIQLILKTRDMFKSDAEFTYDKFKLYFKSGTKVFLVSVIIEGQSSKNLFLLSMNAIPSPFKTHITNGEIYINSVLIPEDTKLEEDYFSLSTMYTEVELKTLYVMEKLRILYPNVMMAFLSDFIFYFENAVRYKRSQNLEI